MGMFRVRVVHGEDEEDEDEEREVVPISSLGITDRVGRGGSFIERARRIVR